MTKIIHCVILDLVQQVMSAGQKPVEMAMILRKWIRAKLETLGVVKDMMVYQVAETEKTIFFVIRIGSMLVWRAQCVGRRCKSLGRNNWIRNVT